MKADLKFSLGPESKSDPVLPRELGVWWESAGRQAQRRARAAGGANPTQTSAAQVHGVAGIVKGAQLPGMGKPPRGGV